MGIRLLLLLAIILALAFLLGVGLSGCATGATGEAESTRAEGGFLVLDLVQTAQDVQIAHNPCCYREPAPFGAIDGGTHPKSLAVIGVGLGLGLAHTLVTSWLDDEVAEHGSNGPWLTTRIVWHAVSLFGETYIVAKNYSDGVTPLKVTGATK
jgi:hypothetical protein